MSNEEQNGFFAKNVLGDMPIVSAHLEDKYGFECKVDYDKDFATDEYYSLKIATYKKKIVGNLEENLNDQRLIAASPLLLNALQDLVKFWEENNVGAELELAYEAINEAVR